MPIVNLIELEKKEKEKKEKENTLPLKKIGDKTYFMGAKGEPYDKHGEALESLQQEKLQAEYKKLGLDEFGRSPAQAALSEAKKKLFNKREEKMAEVKLIDIEIASLKFEDFEKKEKKRQK